MEEQTLNGPHFTNRELQVIALLLRGLSTKMIAAELGIAYNTTRGHLKDIRRLLDVHSTPECIVVLIDMGYTKDGGRPGDERGA